MIDAFEDNAGFAREAGKRRPVADVFAKRVCEHLGRGVGVGVDAGAHHRAVPQIAVDVVLEDRRRRQHGEAQRESEADHAGDQGGARVRPPDEPGQR